MSGFFESVNGLSSIIYIGFGVIVGFLFVSWVVKKILVTVHEKARVSGRLKKIGKIDLIKASGGRKRV